MLVVVSFACWSTTCIRVDMVLLMIYKTIVDVCISTVLEYQDYVTRGQIYREVKRGCWTRILVLAHRWSCINSYFTLMLISDFTLAGVLWKLSV